MEEAERLNTQQIRENQCYKIPEKTRGAAIQSLGGNIDLREKEG